jgi:hypothetical protein
MRLKSIRCKNLKRDDGAALITAMVILVAMTLLGFALLTLGEIEFNIARNQRLAQQALFAAEKGAITGIRVAEANVLNMSVGSTIRIDSSAFRLRDTYPDRWTTMITKEGRAPQKRTGEEIRAGVSKMVAYLYQIRSMGNSSASNFRTVEVLIRLRQKGGEELEHVVSYVE